MDMKLLGEVLQTFFIIHKSVKVVQKIISYQVFSCHDLELLGSSSLVPILNVIQIISDHILRNLETLILKFSHASYSLKVVSYEVNRDMRAFYALTCLQSIAMKPAIDPSTFSISAINKSFALHN